MAGQWMTQLVQDAESEEEAQQMLEFLRVQVDFVGGRLLPPCNQVGRTKWRLQAFMSDCGEENAERLPDGMKRVIVLDSQRTMLGV